MYELTIERTFAAAHAIIIKGEREPLHGHNWRVRLTVAGKSLDSDGLLCDFHALEQVLDRAIGGFHNRNLNETAPFDRVNPTAENVAGHLAQEIARYLPATVGIVRVSVTEAPGCEATFRSDR